MPLDFWSYEGKLKIKEGLSNKQHTDGLEEA